MSIFPPGAARLSERSAGINNKQKMLPDGALAVEQYEIEYTYQQEKDEELLKFLVLFSWQALLLCLQKRFCFVDMSSLGSARYICLAANSICFRFAQTRYDINPRSRSEHIKRVSAYRTRQRISKIRISGFISMRTCSIAGTPHLRLFYFRKTLDKITYICYTVKACRDVGGILIKMRE